MAALTVQDRAERTDANARTERDVQQKSKPPRVCGRASCTVEYDGMCEFDSLQ
jgi:hypothetical protein